MEIVWFILVGFMLTMYILLDGFDLGLGAIFPLVTKDEKEKRAVMKAILPVWDGNEVWLIAAGGALLLSFPLLYASSLSGFYLPLFVVFWLLILRGVGIEMRHIIDNPLWRSLWDGVFFLGSAPLPFFFGVALANVVRGVPIGGDSPYFFQPLWTDPLNPFSSTPGILDWYTVMIGLLTFSALVMHGAAYLVVKTEGGLHTSGRIFSATAWLGTVGLTAVATPLTFHIAPRRFENFVNMPWGYVFPAIAVGGLLAMVYFFLKGMDQAVFACSCAFIIGMMASTVFSVFPNVLPAVDPKNSLTIYNAAAPTHSLVVGLVVWSIGVLLAFGYFFIVYRMFRGKVTVE